MNIKYLFVYIFFIFSSNAYSDFDNIKIKSDNWTVIDRKNYTKNTLFNYIDGEADVHLTYNFKELNVIEFEFKQNKNIHSFAEIYSYNSENDSYGIFSLICRTRKKTKEKNVIYSWVCK